MLRNQASSRIHLLFEPQIETELKLDVLQKITSLLSNSDTKQDKDYSLSDCLNKREPRLSNGESTNLFKKETSSLKCIPNESETSQSHVKQRFSTEDQKVLFEIMLHHFPNWMIPASFFLNLPFSRLKTFVYESIMRLRSLSIAIDFVNQDFVFLKTGGRIVF